MTPGDGYIDCVLKHQINHIRYKDIRIPDKWRQFILDSHRLGPAKVRTHCIVELVMTECAVKIWQDILQRTGGGKDIAFRQKAVRYYWACEGSHAWKCADDPIESAREWCKTIGRKENVEMIEMDAIPHSQAFAFVVNDFMEKWADNTDSFLVDSTCE
jgi:hypothetical protein